MASSSDNTPQPPAPNGHVHADGVQQAQHEHEIEVSNEFATVRVARVLTRNGVRLRIRSPRLHKEIDLDALELESLTWQTTATFSRFLRDPYGPAEG